jgi:prophage tail gpP-like protein
MTLPPIPILEERRRDVSEGAMGTFATPAVRSKPSKDIPLLVVEGKTYGGWHELRATRGLERCAADFDIALLERWPGNSDGWPLQPFAPVELRLGDDPIITGYADVWSPSMDANSTELRVSGRSKVADLIDCSPAEGSGEYRASTLEAIARSFAAPYDIEVENTSGDNQPIALAAYKRSETCFTILDKLARQRGVMLTDGPTGQLIIARGPARDAEAVANLVQGKNILSARLRVDVSKRFSRYEARTQRGVAATVSFTPVGNQPGLPGGAASGGASRKEQQTATRAITDAAGTAMDAEVPRLRVRVVDGEASGDNVTAGARAVWECAVNAGQSIRLEVTVVGWRRDDKRLWAIGDTVAVNLPRLRLARNLVVAQVTWKLDAGGTVTQLELAPAEGFLPEPLPAAASGTSIRFKPAGDQPQLPSSGSGAK